MTRILDRTSEGEVASRALEIVDDLGLMNHEAISGLLKAAFRLAESTSVPEQALDEAASLFADGFPPEEGTDVTEE